MVQNNLKGQKVHVNKDDEQWGRIAEDGIVLEVEEDGALVAIEGNIRANVFCFYDEIALQNQ